MSILNIKGAKKQDIKSLALELGENVTPDLKLLDIKDIICKNKAFLNDPQTVQDLLNTIITDRKELEERELELGKLKLEQEEQEKIRQHELELARIDASRPRQSGENSSSNQTDNKFNDEKEIPLERLIKSIRVLTIPVPTKPELWHVFFSSLERAFDTKKVPPEFKAEILINLLGEKAADILIYINGEELKNYESLKAIVLRQYEPSAQTCLQNFRRAKRQANETHVQFASRLTATWEYYCSLRKVKDWDTINQLIISDKLFQTLDSETSAHINIRQGDSWFKPIQLGKEIDLFFESKRKSFAETDNNFQKSRYNETQQSSSKYVPPPLRRERFKNDGVMNKGGNVKYCYICNLPHLARFCPQNNKSKINSQQTDKNKNDIKKEPVVANVKVKYVDSVIGNHLKPQVDIQPLQYEIININGRQINCIIDSGTEIPTLHSKYVPNFQKENCDSVILNSAFGERVEAKLCKIPVRLNCKKNKILNTIYINFAITNKLNSNCIIPQNVYQMLMLRNKDAVLQKSKFAVNTLMNRPGFCKVVNNAELVGSQNNKENCELARKSSMSTCVKGVSGKTQNYKQYAELRPVNQITWPCERKYKQNEKLIGWSVLYDVNGIDKLEGECRHRQVNLDQENICREKIIEQGVNLGLKENEGISQTRVVEQVRNKISLGGNSVSEYGLNDGNRCVGSVWEKLKLGKGSFGIVSCHKDKGVGEQKKVLNLARESIFGSNVDVRKILGKIKYSLLWPEIVNLRLLKTEVTDEVSLTIYRQNRIDSDIVSNCKVGLLMKWIGEWEKGIGRCLFVRGCLENNKLRESWSNVSESVSYGVVGEDVSEGDWQWLILLRMYLEVPNGSKESSIHSLMICKGIKGSVNSLRDMWMRETPLMLMTVNHLWKLNSYLQHMGKVKICYEEKVKQSVQDLPIVNSVDDDCRPVSQDLLIICANINDNVNEYSVTLEQGIACEKLGDKFMCVPYKRWLRKAMLTSVLRLFICVLCFLFGGTKGVLSITIISISALLRVDALVTCGVLVYVCYQNAMFTAKVQVIIVILHVYINEKKNSLWRCVRNYCLCSTREPINEMSVGVVLPQKVYFHEHNYDITIYICTLLNSC